MKGSTDLFQHEFSHEWFANQLTASNWDDYWLHEGYGSVHAACSMAAGARAMRRYDRDDAGSSRHHDPANKVADRHREAAVLTEEQVYEKRTRACAGQDIYVKGSWMLHTLRGSDRRRRVLRR